MGSTLSAVLGAGPSDGSLSLNANGSFTDNPDGNFNGSDSFTYRASDGSANSNLATVTHRPSTRRQRRPDADPGPITSTEKTPVPSRSSGGPSTDADDDAVTYTLEQKDADDGTTWSSVASWPNVIGFLTSLVH